MVLLIIAVIFGAIIAVLRIYAVDLEGGNVWGAIGNAVAGVGILAGTCFVIYKASKERLMGEGIGFWRWRWRLRLRTGGWRCGRFSWRICSGM